MTTKKELRKQIKALQDDNDYAWRCFDQMRKAHDEMRAKWEGYTENTLGAIDEKHALLAKLSVERKENEHLKRQIDNNAWKHLHEAEVVRSNAFANGIREIVEFAQDKAIGEWIPFRDYSA